jgi:hypothetical protein
MTKTKETFCYHKLALQCYRHADVAVVTDLYTSLLLTGEPHGCNAANEAQLIPQFLCSRRKCP